MNPYIIAAIITGALGLVGVWLNDRSQFRRLVAEGQQNQIEALTKERAEVSRKLDLVLLQDRYKDDYINTLRSHIEQELPPPPPKYPPGLLRIASEGLPA